jgi:hypothetical protein
MTQYSICVFTEHHRHHGRRSITAGHRNGGSSLAAHHKGRRPRGSGHQSSSPVGSGLSDRCQKYAEQPGQVGDEDDVTGVLEQGAPEFPGRKSGIDEHGDTAARLRTHIDDDGNGRVRSQRTHRDGPRWQSRPLPCPRQQEAQPAERKGNIKISFLATGPFVTSTPACSAYHRRRAEHPESCSDIENKNSFRFHQPCDRPNIHVVEVPRPNRQLRRSAGKSDPIDAGAAACTVLARYQLSEPKHGDGPIEASVHSESSDPAPSKPRPHR